VVKIEKNMREILDDIFSTVVAIRRDFHRHPELGLEEFRTADKIEEYLTEWGIEVEQRINKTSVIGLIKGTCHNSVNIGLRADIDALPILEENNCDYKSVIPGKMHACGHDAHIAIQLGAAYILNKISYILPGSVKLFFQQAEETVGGAKKIIEAQGLENPRIDHVLGMHVCPKLSVGTFGVRYGTAYATSDTIIIDVHGKASHAAAPQNGVDAVVVASHVIIALQNLISRNISALDSAVLSFGMINGGVAHNVVADHVKIKGTLRTLDQEVRKYLKTRIFEVAKHVAKAYDADITLAAKPGYDALINDKTTTDIVKDVAIKVLGENNVKILEHPSLGVEDFAYFAKARPSTYNRLGASNTEKEVNLHDSKFDIDEKAMYYGILIQVMSVLSLMGVGTDD